MNNYKQKAEEAWYGILIIYQETNGDKAYDEGIAYITAALEQAYRDGVEAMRDAALERWLYMTWDEKSGKAIPLYRIREESAILLEPKNEEGK